MYILVLMDTECYCTSIRRATRKITELYDAALEPVGINVAQFGLLRRLDRFRAEPLSIQELAERSELERSTVARNVRVLEKRRFVELGWSDEDRRASTILLSAKGLDALERGDPLWHSAQREVEEMLGQQTARKLRSLLLSI
jgi:DNA-binding MarR family transcriptional regulator